MSELCTKVLADAWRAVLGVPAVGPSDHFFDLGGDSIAALRLIARLRDHGLALRMRDLYDTPEFARVAAMVEPVVDVAARPAPVQRLPLLPIQLRTLANDRANPHHHNDDAVLGVPEGVTEADLVEALAALIDHHAVLRSRFGLTPGHEYQEIGHPSDASEPVRIVEVVPEDSALITELGIRTHQELDLTRGRLLAVRILTWRGVPWALLIVVHHMVCDAISWEILVSDLARAIDAVRAGRRPALAGGTDYASWARYLAEYSSGVGLAEPLRYWRSLPWDEVDALGRINPGADRRLCAIQTIRSSVDLPAGLPGAGSAVGSEAAVLGALNFALASVCGASTTLVDVVLNGRDQLRDGPDITRTVGWLAEITPVVTRLGDARGAADVIAATTAQLLAVPPPRLSFGCLRDLTPDLAVRAEFHQLPKADVYLNYRGVRADYSKGPLPELPYRLGPAQCPDERQTHALKLVCDVVDGALQAQWRYSPTELDSHTVQGLADAFGTALQLLGEGSTDR